MRICDWSSDVCSSDLVPFGAGGAQHRDARPSTASYRADRRCRPLRSPADPASSGSVMMERHQILELMGDLKLAGMRPAYDEVIADDVQRDRKSVVQGQRVSVRLELGGYHSIKKNNQTTKNN